MDKGTSVLKILDLILNQQKSSNVPHNILDINYCGLIHHFVYELPHDLPNNLRLIWNDKTSGESLNSVGTQSILQSRVQNEFFAMLKADHTPSSCLKAVRSITLLKKAMAQVFSCEISKSKFFYWAPLDNYFWNFFSGIIFCQLTHSSRKYKVLYLT